VDFHNPTQFELEYIAEDGKAHQPVMVHRALLGSLERFFGVLVEHYAGAFPLWLAPEQGALLHDDRVGRALDGLFDADRRALLTNLVVHMVKEFQVSLTQLHKDSTSLTLHGTYEPAPGACVAVDYLAVCYQ